MTKKNERELKINDLNCYLIKNEFATTGHFFDRRHVVWSKKFTFFILSETVGRYR